MKSKGLFMFSTETTLLGLALALDAAVVSFAIGLLNSELGSLQRKTRGLIIASMFGVFQGLMIWLGSIGGYMLSFSQIGYIFQLVVGVLFIAIGVSVLKESFEEDDEKFEWGLAPLITLAVATSLDALAAGISFGTIPRAWVSALEIGIITTLVCISAYFSSRFLRKLPTKWILRFASVIFFLLGGRVIVDYYF